MKDCGHIPKWGFWEIRVKLLGQDELEEEMGCRKCCNRSLCTVGQNQLQRTKTVTPHWVYCTDAASRAGFYQCGAFQALFSSLLHATAMCWALHEGQGRGPWCLLLSPCSSRGAPWAGVRVPQLCGFISSQPGISLGFQGLPCPDLWGEHDFSPTWWGIAASVVHLHNSRFGNAELCWNRGSSKVQPGGLILSQTRAEAESW